MIRSRRQTHARVFRALAVALPFLFIMAIVRRPASPTLADAAAPLLRQSDYPDRQPPTGEGDGGFDVQLVAQPGAQNVLVLRPRAPTLRPDTLLYWSATRPEGDALPHDAVLIGHLAGDAARELTLPKAFAETPGTVVIYSLGHQDVVDTIALDSVPHTDDRGP